MTSPENWRKYLKLLPYDNLGLNYDPSHLYGSRLITLNQFMSLKIRFSMCITKISKYTRIN